MRKPRVVEAMTEGPFERFTVRGSFAFFSSEKQNPSAGEIARTKDSFAHAVNPAAGRHAESSNDEASYRTPMTFSTQANLNFSHHVRHVMGLMAKVRARLVLSLRFYLRI